MRRRLRILLWHVHGSWTTAFVQGRHEYVVPVTSDRGRYGRGRAQTWQWPKSVVEIPPGQLCNEPFDVAILQQPHEIELADLWLARRPGKELPAIFLEHNTPGGDVPFTRHPFADQPDIPIVHVTHFNQLFWDCGSTRTTVIEHGIVDPGYRYSGEQARAAVVVNDPVRRWRAVGADLLSRLSRAAPLDVFGMNVTGLRSELAMSPERLASHEDMRQDQLHEAMASRRVYVHTSRWTSLGLSLLEAMFLGMPIVALATTEVTRAIPADAGLVSNCPEELAEAIEHFVTNDAAARTAGARAREAAMERYGLERFLDDWDAVLEQIADRG